MQITEESEFSKLRKAEPKKDEEKEKEELLKRADKKFSKGDASDAGSEKEPETDDEIKADKSKPKEKDPEVDCEDDEDCKKSKTSKTNENYKGEQMKLLIEEANELECIVTEEINESNNKEKNYYIQGIFSTPDKKNRNGRVYSTALWEKAIGDWKMKSEADPKYTLGELEHPSRVDPDPMKAVMKIVELKLEDGVVKGKAKILNNNSPETNQMKALIDEGIKIGVSSRGVGRMKGSMVEEFNLSCYDVVNSPSDYNASLSGIVENTEKSVVLNENTGKYVCDENGCALENITETTKHETKCEKAAAELLETFKTYTHIETELTETEKLAIQILRSSKQTHDTTKEDI